MTNLNGGYVMLDLASTKVYEDAKAAVAARKPILVYDNGKCYYADTFEVDGDSNVVITKGGKTITIEPDGDVTSVGSVEYPLMENVKDKNGNLRFIEGDITGEVIAGIEQIYGKWSLSGTHLMIVYCFSVENGTSISGGTTLTNVNLPKWIMDKIIPINSTGYLDRRTFDYVDNSTTFQTAVSGISKISDEQLKITGGTITLTANRVCRIAFDLLIDAE